MEHLVLHGSEDEVMADEGDTALPDEVCYKFPSAHKQKL